MDKPQITSETRPDGTVIESWPLGESVLEMKGIPFVDLPANQSGEVQRVRTPHTFPLRAQTVTWKNEDCDTMSGPVYVDGAPLSEVSWPDTGWSVMWYTRDFARTFARNAGAVFTES